MGRTVTLLRRLDALRLRTRLLALWKLLRHRDTPLAPKLVALLVLAYALSPIDLVPDFIPVIGQLDDLLLVPLGIALVVKLTPRELWQARLLEAEQGAETLPRLLWGAVLVVLTWLLVVGGVGWWLWRSAAGSP